MKNINIVSYLYFLDKYMGVNNSFYSALFHFYRYVSLNSNLSWKKLFWFFDDTDYPMDTKFDEAIRTLLHHQYIDSNFKVTQEGNSFLQVQLAEINEYKTVLDDFNRIYKNETYKEKSCYIKNHAFPVACHLCTNKVCQPTKINKQDLLDAINFKGFRNPYKKIIYKNPHSGSTE